MIREKIIFGDFQTPLELCDKICQLLVNNGVDPEVLIEPTCGKGNFIESAIKYFTNLKKIYGLEINDIYIDEIKNKFNKKVEIIQTNAFTFDYSVIANKHKNKKILVLGNPPWVNNATVGSLKGDNLPVKSNFKNHKGFDAQTGKSNFDISEFMLLWLLDNLSSENIDIALIIKNSVIKNLIQDLPKYAFTIAEAKQYRVDSKKYFDVSVEASLMYLKTSSPKTLTCGVYNNLENSQLERTFGWLNNSFVADINLYNDVVLFDGISPYIWRHGLKHDCSKVMELKKENGIYKNKLNEIVNIEEDLIYPVVNGTDIRHDKIGDRFVIVTQKKVGEKTDYIKEKYPLTYKYLSDHKDYFDLRKSIIYNNKNEFAIFGIGDYSFKEFKIAISSLHEEARFLLLKPYNEKSVMVDDTCYSLGFDSLEEAQKVLDVLSSDIAQKFFKAIVFKDAKRKYTKEILMRFNIETVIKRPLRLFA